jgi:hypothetical protein
MVKVIVDGQTFKTKKELNEHVRRIILSNLNRPIAVDHPDYPFIDALCARHPDGFNETDGVYLFANSETHSPIKGSFTRTETFRPCYKGESGQWVSFSLKKCISGLEQSNDSIVIEALRVAVDSDIKEYRKRFPICSQCGCTQFENLEVDHIVPFKDIAGEFMRAHEDIETREEHLRNVVADEDIRARWYEFHKGRAVLQTLCKQCHKRKTYGRV